MAVLSIVWLVVSASTGIFGQRFPLIGIIGMGVFTILFFVLWIGKVVRDRMQGKHDG